MSTAVHPPSMELYVKIRAAFILREDTLSAWCRRNGIHPTKAQRALTGPSRGLDARALRARIIKAAGLPSLEDEIEAISSPSG